MVRVVVVGGVVVVVVVFAYYTPALGSGQVALDFQPGPSRSAVPSLN